jgi:Icc-related predicted phosphoesterase
MKGMMTMHHHISNVVAASDPQGHLEYIERFVRYVTESGADAVAVLGNLLARGATSRTHGALFKMLAETRLPTFYIPGPQDVPIQEYLRDAANIEIIYPYLHGVHGTFSLAPGSVIFTGFGGTIVDEPQTEREEREELRYPRWEVEYRLKFLSELKDYQKIFLFTTPPAHKGLHNLGSTVLAEMIKSYRPRLVLVRGEVENRQELLGTSLVVMPGRLSEGRFSRIDLRAHTVQPGTLD